VRARDRVQSIAAWWPLADTSKGYHRLAMAEQLSFRLEPAMPRPGDLAPMWPIPQADPFDSPDWLFEPTWGGHRVLVFVEPGATPGGGEVRVVDARGVDHAGRLPELAGLAVRVAATSAVLDGELVVVDPRGHADDDALRARLTGHPGRTVALLVFDLLHLDGRWLLGQPLEKRRAALRRVLRPGDEVVVVPAIAGEGRALHAAVSAQGVAGVLARRRTSPYLPGVHSTLWRAIPAAVRSDPPTTDDADASATAREAGTAGPTDAAGPAGTASGPGDLAAEGGAGPVLAVFRRLPFPDEPENPPGG
jgi:ATP-dependent DNA ligase